MNKKGKWLLIGLVAIFGLSLIAERPWQLTKSLNSAF